MDYNKLSDKEILKLYDDVSYWCYKFPSQFGWLILAFFVSFIFNGGYLIQIGIVVYVLYGITQYNYYKKIEIFLHENNPFKKLFDDKKGDK